MKNFKTSCAVAIPPTATTGMRTAAAISHTFNKAIGKIAGPESPARTRANVGWPRSRSMSMPASVLIATTASAPPCSAALANRAMSVTLGVSLIATALSGKRSFTVRVKRSTARASAASRSPPSSTFGQPRFTSTAGTSARSASRSAMAAYSCNVAAEMLTNGTPRASTRGGSLSRRYASMPTFCNPMEFSKPDGVS